jgi:glycosyltransferase involved in cell wall biosynthesis
MHSNGSLSHRPALLRNRSFASSGFAPRSPCGGLGGCDLLVQTQRPRRIGLLIDTLIGGGAERVVLNLACAFRDLGHEVHVILVRREVQHSVPQGIAVHALAEADESCGSKQIDKMMLAWRLRRLVAGIERDGRGFDFFISNAEDSDRLSALAGLPRVYIRYRNSMYEYLRHKIGNKTGFKRLWRELKWNAHFRAVYGGRDIVTVSNALHDDILIKSRVKPRSLRTIYNPFDFEAIRRQADAYKPAIDGPYLIYAARFNSRKRQDLLLDAFSRSNARYTHRLVLLGDAYTASEKDWRTAMEQQVHALGLHDRVAMPGFQTNPYPWIRHADLFVMSSDSEGLPTVLIESLILGTPVVSTDCPTGPSEIMTDELARFLCPRDDAPRLAELIDQALLQYPQISEASLGRFSAATSAQQYLDYCVRQSVPRHRQVLEAISRRWAWWSA